MMYMKKLSLDEAKKAVLTGALERAAAKLDPDMRSIYDQTIAQARTAQDRIMLTASQVEIVKCALDTAPHGPESEDMLDQLLMTRREYQAAHAA